MRRGVRNNNPLGALPRNHGPLLARNDYDPNPPRLMLLVPNKRGSSGKTRVFLRIPNTLSILHPPAEKVDICNMKGSRQANFEA